MLLSEIADFSRQDQPPQCEQVYRSAEQPKITNNIFNSISSACHYAGGMWVLHKVLTSENSNEPTGVLSLVLETIRASYFSPAYFGKLYGLKSRNKEELGEWSPRLK